MLLYQILAFYIRIRIFIRISVNKIENRNYIQNKDSTESEITNDKNGENMPHLEITEVVLVHCNIVKNHYQQDSRVLYTFVPNKSFGQLSDISPKKFIFLKIFNSEFSNIEYGLLIKPVSCWR